MATDEEIRAATSRGRRGPTIHSARRRAGWAALLGSALVAAVLLAATATPVVAAPTLAWHRSYDGPAHRADAFESVAVSGGGAIVAGYTSTSAGQDVIVRRYAASGAVAWTRLWGGRAGGNDRAKAVIPDRAGGSYVAGTVAGRGGDVLVLRLSAGGAVRWTRRYDSGGARHDEGLFAVRDGAGGVYVVGTSGPPVKSSWRVLRYDARGRLLWTRAYAAAKGSAMPADADTDGAGRLFVTGWSEYSGGKVRAVTRAYRPGGRLAWSRSLVLDQVTRASGVSCAPDGVYVAASGMFFGEIVDTARIVKYRPSDGATSWSAPWLTVPGGTPYELRDVVSLPLVGSVAVGAYALAPGMGAALLYRDTSGGGAEQAVWADPGKAWAGQFAVRDTAGGAWMVGFHETAISVARFAPTAGATAALDCAPFAFNTANAATASGAAALYVAGAGQGSGPNLQAQILRIEL